MKQITVPPLHHLLFGLPHTLYSSFTCASASIYSVVLFLCVQGCGIYSLTPTEALHQVVFLLELEKGRFNLVPAGSVLGRSDRSAQPV